MPKALDALLQQQIKAATVLVVPNSIIALGQTMRLDIVAEGVETAGQQEFLRRSGCAYAQGYHFGRPVPAADFEAFFSAEDPAEKNFTAV